MRGTIFIAGVHGVGKSTAAELLTTRYGVPHYTASKIIKEMRSTIDPDSGKLVSNVAANQELLISGVQKILQKHPSFILDGHFTLLNKFSEIEKIDIDVFKRLSISGVILLKEMPTTIYSRLANRDVSVMPVDIINRHQVAEEEYANYVSSLLGIPICILSGWAEPSLFEVYDKFITD